MHPNYNLRTHLEAREYIQLNFQMAYQANEIDDIQKFEPFAHQKRNLKYR